MSTRLRSIAALVVLMALVAGCDAPEFEKIEATAEGEVLVVSGRISGGDKVTIRIPRGHWEKYEKAGKEGSFRVELPLWRLVPGTQVLEAQIAKDHDTKTKRELTVEVPAHAKVRLDGCVRPVEGAGSEVLPSVSFRGREKETGHCDFAAGLFAVKVKGPPSTTVTSAHGKVSLGESGEAALAIDLRAALATLPVDAFARPHDPGGKQLRYRAIDKALPAWKVKLESELGEARESRMVEIRSTVNPKFHKEGSLRKRLHALGVAAIEAITQGRTFVAEGAESTPSLLLYRPWLDERFDLYGEASELGKVRYFAIPGKLTPTAAGKCGPYEFTHGSLKGARTSFDRADVSFTLKVVDGAGKAVAEKRFDGKGRPCPTFEHTTGYGDKTKALVYPDEREIEAWLTGIAKR